MFGLNFSFNSNDCEFNRSNWEENEILKKINVLEETATETKKELLAKKSTRFSFVFGKLHNLPKTNSITPIFSFLSTDELKRKREVEESIEEVERKKKARLIQDEGMSEEEGIITTEESEEITDEDAKMSEEVSVGEIDRQSHVPSIKEMMDTKFVSWDPNTFQPIQENVNLIFKDNALLKNDNKRLLESNLLLLRFNDFLITNNQELKQVNADLMAKITKFESSQSD